MRSIGMCEAILAAHAGRCDELREEHLIAVKALDHEFVRRLRGLEVLKASAEADKARIRAAAKPRLTEGGPFVVRNLAGEFWTHEEHWIREPDEARYHVQRYPYRAVAERQARMTDAADVRSWAQYEADRDEQRYRRDNARTDEPQMPPGDTIIAAEWDAYEAAHQKWKEAQYRR